MNELDNIRIRHYKTGTPEYRIWQNMKTRCSNPANKFYKNYGGRGIKVCDEWLQDFPRFLQDMGKRPTPKHTLDRIDNNGDYEPSNCRWATWNVQANNKRWTAGADGIPYVSWDNIEDGWRAQKQIDGKKIHVGYYSDPKQALDALIDKIVEKKVAEQVRLGRIDELSKACHYWEENPTLPATYMIDRTAQLKDTTKGEKK